MHFLVAYTRKPYADNEGPLHSGSLFAGAFCAFWGFFPMGMKNGCAFCAFFWIFGPMGYEDGYMQPAVTGL